MKTPEVTSHDGKSLKAKTRKGNEKSKHSVQTNSRASDPAAARLLCGSVYLGTHFRVSPRRGAVQWHCLGETSEFLPPCTIHAHASNFGNATHLGAFTGSGESFQDFCEDPPNITYTGTFHWFAANGDELSGTFEGFLSPTGTPGVYDNHETSDVTGGTGRFTSATGHWESGGQIDVTAEPLFFALPFHGWISSVGSTRRER
jgi:hypothetical protein